MHNPANGIILPEAKDVRSIHGADTDSGCVCRSHRLPPGVRPIAADVGCSAGAPYITRCEPVHDVPRRAGDGSRPGGGAQHRALGSSVRSERGEALRLLERQAPPGNSRGRLRGGAGVARCERHGHLDTQPRLDAERAHVLWGPFLRVMTWLPPGLPIPPRYAGGPSPSRNSPITKRWRRAPPHHEQSAFLFCPPNRAPKTPHWFVTRHPSRLTAFRT